MKVGTGVQGTARGANVQLGLSLACASAGPPWEERSPRRARLPRAQGESWGILGVGAGVSPQQSNPRQEGDPVWAPCDGQSWVPGKAVCALPSPVFLPLAAPPPWKLLAYCCWMHVFWHRSTGLSFLLHSRGSSFCGNPVP